MDSVPDVVEFPKLRALRAFVPSHLTRLRALRAFAPYLPWFLRALHASFAICAPYSLAI